MKLDILALMVHPDDAELACSGTLALHVKQGKKVGIVDFTEGELGTNGTPEERLKEAEEAGKILGLSVRDNLGMADGFFENNREHQLEIIKKIRQYRPEIVITNALEDRHPDHGRAAKLSIDSCFLSGLIKIETELEGQKQEAWRPKKIFHIIQSNLLEPDFVVDITEVWEQKVEAMAAFKSQFHTSKSDTEKETFISTPLFMQFIDARAREFGHKIGVKYGEGFVTHQKIQSKNLFDL